MQPQSTLQAVREDLAAEHRIMMQLIWSLLSANLVLLLIVGIPGMIHSWGNFARALLIPIFGMWLCVYFGAPLAKSRAAIAALRGLQARATLEETAAEGEQTTPTTRDFLSFKKTFAEHLNTSESFETSIDRLAVAFIIVWAVLLVVFVINIPSNMASVQAWEAMRELYESF